MTPPLSTLLPEHRFTAEKQHPWSLLRLVLLFRSAPVLGGTCESRCLVSGVTTDPEPCGFARPRMAVRGFPVSGEKGILVVEPSPGEDEILAGLQKQAVVAVKRITIRKDGQEQPTKYLILTFELHTLPTTVKAVPNPQQRQQLPPVSGGSAPAASRPRDRQGTPLSVPTPRAPAREKERESRPNSRERASSKERHRAASSTAEGQGRMELGDAQPSTSTTAPLSEGGRGRAVRPRASTLPRPIQQASSQEVEAKDEATELSALSSDQDDMEWETTKSKKKQKKPVIPPK
ncbi:hypothetical protein ISCGN_003183 [Ixodes scapularis]